MFDQIGSVVLRQRTHYPKWDAGQGSADFSFCMVLLDVGLSIFWVYFMPRPQLNLNPMKFFTKDLYFREVINVELLLDSI
jgi:hypothetical protein